MRFTHILGITPDSGLRQRSFSFSLNNHRASLFIFSSQVIKLLYRFGKSRSLGSPWGSPWPELLKETFPFIKGTWGQQDYRWGCYWLYLNGCLSACQFAVPALPTALAIHHIFPKSPSCEERMVDHGLIIAASLGGGLLPEPFQDIGVQPDGDTLFSRPGSCSGGSVPSRTPVHNLPDPPSLFLIGFFIPEIIRWSRKLNFCLSRPAC